MGERFVAKMKVQMPASAHRAAIPRALIFSGQWSEAGENRHF
jgi:hypothetical protein